MINRATMYMEMFTPPACSPPPTTVMIELMNSAQRRPNRSAVQMQESVPKRPPVWKRPLMAPMRSLALERVSRAK